jgi:AcrR family transcriptional regulator
MQRVASGTQQTPVEQLDGVMPASQARSRDARDRLLKAGERVFARMGYDAAHVSDIAEAADCSIGSFYRRFRDKEAFFGALHHRFTGRYRDNTRKFFELTQWESKPTALVIGTFIANTAEIMTRNQGFFRALLQRTLAGAGEDYWPKMRKAGEQQGKSLAAFLEKRGEASGPDLAMQATLALRIAEGALLHRLIGVGAVDRDAQLISVLAGMVLRQLDLDDAPRLRPKKPKKKI